MGIHTELEFLTVIGSSGGFDISRTEGARFRTVEVFQEQTPGYTVLGD